MQCDSYYVANLSVIRPLEKYSIVFLNCTDGMCSHVYVWKKMTHIHYILINLQLLEQPQEKLHGYISKLQPDSPAEAGEDFHQLLILQEVSQGARKGYI